mmetsp:Transcript_11117/g.36736  ORF Transcript_11117/g.36736 Transcript_11117/m.36736 type:complete len:139 (-) Transcript_11117:140-556(-)
MMMVQEFQRSAETAGETSHVWIAGAFTHAVLKKPAPGDFRVQDNFGGTVEPYIPTAEDGAFLATVERAFVDDGLFFRRQPLVYARVDVIRDNDGHLALAELELIEPELWFRHNPKAADTLATAVHRILLEDADPPPGK